MNHLRGKRSYEDGACTSNAVERKKLSTDLYLTYDILRIVFKYLNGIDLSNASQVCRSWLEVVNDEKRTRMGPMYRRTRMNSTHFPKNKYLKEQVKESLQARPSLGLMFKAPRFSQSYINYWNPDCCCRILPRKCALITLNTLGVVINNKEIEGVSDNVVYLHLPEIPNVHINVVTSDSLSSIEETVLKTIHEDFDGPIRELRRCLLLFCNQDGRTPVNDALKFISSRDKFSVWGGVVKELHICHSMNHYGAAKCNNATFYVGVCISGLIMSWSVVIDENHNTKESVEQALNSFKEQVSLRKHSMGLMFACCERGESMFKDCNVESTIFKKLFPEVPLVGCFGDGEFGKSVGTLPAYATAGGEDWYNERIYVVGLIFKWIKEHGNVEGMEKLAIEKSKMVYDVINESKGFYSCPVKSDVRSRMNVPFRIGENNEELEKEFVSEATARGMLQLKGHRTVGGIRVSLYNAITVGEVEKLVEYMKWFYQKHN